MSTELTAPKLDAQAETLQAENLQVNNICLDMRQLAAVGSRGSAVARIMSSGAQLPVNTAQQLNPAALAQNTALHRRGSSSPQQQATSRPSLQPLQGGRAAMSALADTNDPSVSGGQTDLNPEPNSAKSRGHLPRSHSPALQFEVLAQQGRSRASRMTLPHGVCLTPMFMPVGTQGTVKGMTNEQVASTGSQLMLGNTYHLESRPGSAVVAALGGLHGFIGWKRPMLTDSGGFQMVSLLHLAEITEEGVNFESPRDGAMMLLTPEQSIAIQNRLGADIIMQLDDVVPSTAQSPARFEEATYRTTRWLDRCIKAHSRPDEQSLFPIIQGGTDPTLRTASLKELISRDMPGYAIGGLAGGEDKIEFIRVVSQCTAALPADRPRYVMGIGYPMDILMCSALGADMFDSVFPTRTARFGVALVPGLSLKLRNKEFETDYRAVDVDCSCLTCKRYTRAYLHSVVCRKLPFACALISIHNLTYLARLGFEIREAITEQRFPEYARELISLTYPDGIVPDWVREAMRLADIDLHG